MSKKNKTEELDEMMEEGQQAIQDAEQPEAATEEHEIPREEQLQAELDRERDKFLRLFAEFENYKKRTLRERMELFKTAGQEVISSLLPVLDDLERALREIAKSPDKELFKGLELIDNKFRETLKSKGLSEIEVNPGDVFDAEVHEAITQVPAPDKKMKGKVIDVVEKGFRLGDKIIRHPKVVVGN